MSEVKGIQNLKELADFVLGIGNGVSASLADGKMGLTDLLHFQGAVFTALPAFQGIDQVDEEFFDLSETEKAELNAYVASKLQLAPGHAKVEQIVESVLTIVVEFKALIAQLVGAKQA